MKEDSNEDIYKEEEVIGKQATEDTGTMMEKLSK